MPRRLEEWFARIKDVEREFNVVRQAVDRLVASSTTDPGVLHGGLRPRDARIASDRLDGTYVVRLFAEFETGLRQFWSAARSNEPPSRTRDLLDGIASTCRIPFEIVLAAHEVRGYRNSLVHERDDPVDAIAVPIARKSLCVYLRYLPSAW